MAWTAPRTWVAGEIVTAAYMNTHVRDNLLTLSTWAAWTPQIDAVTTDPNHGSTATQYGTYLLAGTLCVASFDIKWGGVGVTGGDGNYRINHPVAASTAGQVVTGHGVLTEHTPLRWLTSFKYQTNLLSLLHWDEATGAGLVSHSAPFSWGTANDRITGVLLYRGA
jgi:hypothetical protein